MTQLAGKCDQFLCDGNILEPVTSIMTLILPRNITDRKKLNHLSQVCHKLRAKPTIIKGNNHTIYEKTRNTNKDI